MPVNLRLHLPGGAGSLEEDQEDSDIDDEPEVGMDLFSDAEHEEEYADAIGSPFKEDSSGSIHALDHQNGGAVSDEDGPSLAKEPARSAFNTPGGKGAARGYGAARTPRSL
mmetsp:Transcript_47347/g.81420  ORF Transcript_47347/g.81420 Transcript_47347/m.81420 type:complete len:111 (-) Transcript_47347:92-424(-)|eukprot:CAMPEP_0206374670 /NCGR_PEP_ID=MMETSP0294-20121207/8445_1 /ASSEMBLY_ACC=CAM_ASM_000327 /TAXON_ID=39354 /ORGANISM="Heterosigma akashiwo, Strain CCMP2393" /LENGTH=110 /DNA_ID=CAMNT_0053822489 /DNA_START=152 /DNA_END=484 /DNA_ORIENTATION=+